MNNPLFALVDCDNFFVACEKIFRPDLEGKPIVVLSSNDGCAIARSKEAKALGIPMAAPAFKYKQLFKQAGVVQFSANFELYGDISRRITALLTTVTPRVEVYSVDELFLDLSQLTINDLTAWAVAVRTRIQRWVGVPVSIGIAGSKTLAKLASDQAKKDPTLSGVLDLVSIKNQALQKRLQAIPIQSVWGVGWRLAPKLKAEGILTASHLAGMNPRLAQKLMGIHGRHMVYELNGTSCLPLELAHKPPKSIAATRTFGNDTSDYYALEAAIATFSSRAAFKLRHSQQLTKRASLFITSNKHKPGYRSWSREITFEVPTADTGLISNQLIALLLSIYQPRVEYHRAGVLLHDFLPDNYLQADLLGRVDIRKHDQAIARSQAIDKINSRYGNGSLHYAAEDLANIWEPKHNLRSPRYTSQWNELAAVKVI